MFEWASDGALFGAQRRHHHATNSAALKEVGLLVGASAATSGALSAIAAYNHTQDPTKGMPQIGPLGLDTALGILGVVAAVFGDQYLGDGAQTVALGIGLGGINSTAMSYGAAMGVQAASTKGLGGKTKGWGAGMRKLHGNRTSGLSPEAQKIYEQYMGK